VLRALQSGISIKDLELLSIGAVIDIIIEAGNDNADYKELETREATQADINKFFG
jgi:hypothetical protein